MHFTVYSIKYVFLMYLSKYTLEAKRYDRSNFLQWTRLDDVEDI